MWYQNDCTLLWKPKCLFLFCIRFEIRVPEATETLQHCSSLVPSMVQGVHVFTTCPYSGNNLESLMGQQGLGATEFMGWREKILTLEKETLGLSGPAPLV